MYETTQWLGWAFCESSFRWFGLFDVPLDEKVWAWHDHVSYSIGGNLYRVGCYFYDLGGDK